MAIDVAADIASILGTDADFTRTTGTWTKSDGTTLDSVTGILWERAGEALDEGTTTQLTALFVVAKTEFTNVTIWNAGDTLTVAGEAAWTVASVKVRHSHIFVDLIKDVQRGRSA